MSTATPHHFVPAIPVIGPAHLILGFARDISRPERFVAVGGQRVDVALLTEDGGQTWSVLPSPGKGLRGAFLDGDTLWVCGEYGFLAHSRDGGGSFTVVDTGASGCLFGVAVDENGVVWCCGDGGFVIASVDGGETFKRINGAGVSLSRMYRAPWGVLVPTDAPGDVLLLTSPKKKPNLKRISVGARCDLMTATTTTRGTTVLVGAGGACFRSEDEGQSFTRVDSGTTALLCGVCATDDGRVFAVGAKGTVLVSDDDAKSFEPATTGLSSTLWSCIAIGNNVFIGGEAGLIAKLVSLEEALKASVSPPEVRRDLVDGVIIDDELRAMVHPWRGASPALYVAPPPLPPAADTWRRLRAAFWATDRYYTALSAKDSAIWEMATGASARFRAVGERLLDPELRPIDDDDALTLARVVFDKVWLWGPFANSLADSLVDLLVATVGVEAAVVAALRALPWELPYTGVGMFSRLRARAVLADDAVYAALLARVPQVLDEELALSAKSRSRVVDLECAASFLLPPGARPHDVERTLLQRAAVHIGRFGDSNTAHASLLASGDADVVQRFLAKNVGRHELFAGGTRPYLATTLIRGEPSLRSELPKLRSRYDTNVDIWATLLGRVDDGAVVEHLFDQRRAKPARAVDDALAWRANLDRAAVARVIDGLTDPTEKASAQGLLAPRSPPRALNQDTLLGRLGAPSTWVPPAALAVAPLQVPPELDLPPSLDFHDDERGSRPYDGHWTFQRTVTSTDGRPPIRTFEGDDAEAYVAFRERWQLPTPGALYALLPNHLHPRLLALGTARSPNSPLHWRASVVKGGEAVLPALRAWVHSEDDLEDRLSALAPIGDVACIGPIVEAFVGKKNKALARKWILRHRQHAIAGALTLLVVDDVGNAHREGAARVLRFLDGLGARDAIVVLARRHDAELVARTETLLDEDPLLLPGAKIPTIPAWASPTGSSTLPTLVGVDGNPRNNDDVLALLQRLAISNVDELHPALRAATRTTTAASLAAFARSLFQAWLDNGADPKQVWCMLAVGVFGDDDLVRTLGGLVKNWPGESAAARAQQGLDVLVVHGSDVALLQVSLIAEKSKFAALKKGAGERIAAIAERRGLSRDELADRLVPTFGLDDVDGGTLDFGPRRFTVTFDEHLAPRVRDEAGVVLKDLPKPSKNDDAALAKAAKARLSGLKKDVKAVADLLLRRLERAMLESRTIEADVFRSCFVDHPLSFHVARRLVWEALDANGHSLGRFRIAEDRTFADADDNAWRLPAGARVVVLHPLDLDEASLSTWSALFGDYELLQPFPQLGRGLHRVADDERSQTSLTRFSGRTLNAPTLVFGLEARGWRREEAGDGGSFQSHDRRLGGVCATVGYDGSVGMGFIEESEILTVDAVTFTTTRALVVEGGRELPNGTTLALADVPPALFSEVIEDLKALLS